MTKSELHDVSIAVASCMFDRYKDKMQSELNTEDLYYFAKMYKFSLKYFEENFNNID